jgi:hypothetical protein
VLVLRSVIFCSVCGVDGGWPASNGRPCGRLLGVLRGGGGPIRPGGLRCRGTGESGGVRRRGPFVGVVWAGSSSSLCSSAMVGPTEEASNGPLRQAPLPRPW